MTTGLHSEKQGVRSYNAKTDRWVVSGRGTGQGENCSGAIWQPRRDIPGFGRRHRAGRVCERFLGREELIPVPLTATRPGPGLWSSIRAASIHRADACTTGKMRKTPRVSLLISWLAVDPSRRPLFSEHLPGGRAQSDRDPAKCQTVGATPVSRSQKEALRFWSSPILGSAESNGKRGGGGRFALPRYECLEGMASGEFVRGADDRLRSARGGHSDCPLANCCTQFLFETRRRTRNPCAESGTARSAGSATFVRRRCRESPQGEVEIWFDRLEGPRRWRPGGDASASRAASPRARACPNVPTVAGVGCPIPRGRAVRHGS